MPERDAERNTPADIAARQSVEELWQHEHRTAGTLPSMQVDLQVYYADDRVERAMPLAQAQMYAVDAYLLDLEFAVYLPHGEVLACYDGDILRSTCDVGWARRWIGAGVTAVLDIISFHAAPESKAEEVAPAPAPDKAQHDDRQ